LVLGSTPSGLTKSRHSSRIGSPILLSCLQAPSSSKIAADYALARTLWQYHQLGHELSPADAIFVLCSHDIAVAERGAQLFLD
jgi:hypothetical protein